MKKTTVTFARTKETPGAFRFTETDKDGNVLDQGSPELKMGSVYLRKSAFGDKVPNEITVTVS